MINTSDIRIATTKEGYLDLFFMLNNMAEINVRSYRQKYMPLWLRLIYEEVDEAEAECRYAGNEILATISSSAKNLLDDAVYDVNDNYGVIFGWDNIEWDANDVVYASFIAKLKNMTEPARFIRVSTLDDHETITNNILKADDSQLAYDIDVDICIEHYWPPEWFARQKPIDKPLKPAIIRDIAKANHIADIKVKLPFDDILQIDSIKNKLASLICTEPDVVHPFYIKDIQTKDDSLVINVTLSIDE